MSPRSIAAALLFFALPAAAQPPLAGDWVMRAATHSEASMPELEGVRGVHLALHTPGLNTRYVPLADFAGLGPEQLASSAPARFHLRQDPGTFEFAGSFAGGRGRGRFTFTPDPAFAAELERRGMQRPTPAQQFSMARHGVALAYLDELAAQGYARPTTAALDRAGMSGADLLYLRQMGALGYRLGTLEALMRLSNSGVNPGYLREMRTLGYGGLSAELLIRLRNHGVTASFAERMNARAGRRLAVEELVRTRSRGER
ncbi:MAG TPA: hypothetical protein VF584_07545 [Longimicrobium sp.]|jgi:hypothetical protein